MNRVQNNNDKEWKCKDCCCFKTDACHYPTQLEEYKACEHLVVDYDEAYQQGKADAIDEFYKVIEPYIQDINTNEVWSHSDNEKMMFDWLMAWKIALYRDLEKLKGAEE